MVMALRWTILAVLIPLAALARQSEESMPLPRDLDVALERSEQLQPALARVHPVWREFRPEWRSEPCPFSPRIDFDKGRVECGYVLVPENRRDPGSRLIRLSIARVDANVDDPPAGTSVYLQGGPGGPATPTAAALLSSSSERAEAMRRVSHWLFPDHRGVGFSEPYFCRGIFSDLADAAPYSAAGRARFEEDIANCLEEARLRGIDITAYTTWDSAMDMRDIRRALGLDQWNLYGISYGTELGQMVLRVDEAGTRAAVLDSVVAPPPASWERFSLGMESALTALNRACQAHGRCAERFGDLEQLARNAVDAYREAPLAVEGVDPYVAPSGTLTLNHHLAAWGLFQALYARDLYPALPAMIESWDDLDAERTRAYVGQLARAAGPDWGHGYQFIANCTGSVLLDADQRRSIEREAGFWGEALVDGHFTDSCNSLGMGAPDPLNQPVGTDVPVLVAAGAVDPITPPQYAEAILPGLENATYIELPYTGHGATAVPCGAEIMAAFLQHPDRTPATDCIDAMEPPDFVTEYKPTPGLLRLTSMARDGRYLSLAWGVVPALLLTVAVFAFPLAAIGRRVDGTGVAARGPRLLAWIAAALAVLGVALLASAVVQTVSTSPALVPLGLIGPIGAATAALIAALFGAVCALWLLRGNRRPLGTTVAISLTAVSVALVVWFTLQHQLLF